METRLTINDASIIDRCFVHDDAFERFDALVDTFLWQNKAVADYLPMMDGPTDEPNTCQKTLATIALLDVEVPNGGLLQFFWNCPGWVNEVSPSLPSLGLSVLADMYDHSIAELVGEFGTYSEFRKINTLEAFSECASKFSFREFDSKYYDRQERTYAAPNTPVTKHGSLLGL